MTKRIFNLIVFAALFNSFPLLAQRKSSLLEIYSITEYIDGYVIKAFNKLKTDTLNIISVKKGNADKQHYTRMRVGKKYTFQIEDPISQMSAVPSGTLVIRIKRTVVWKDGDGVTEIPVFAVNTRGLWIKN